MPVITYRDALNQALREEMQRDDRVFLMGEEVGVYQGAYKVSKGLLQEFGEIQEEAHDDGIPAIAWIYPRGEAVKNDTSPEIVSYAARAGLEVGADAVKIKYSGSPETFSWAVKAAGLIKVFMSGGPKAPTDETFLSQVKGAMDGGAAGLAVGRNVWQHQEPLKMASALREIIFNGREVAKALQLVVVQ